MASRLSLYFSLLFVLFAIAASAARYTPANPTASKERNGGMMAMNVHFAERTSEDDNTIHRLLAGHEEMTGLQDYADTRANHRHDPHHPLAVKGNDKELDG